MLKVSVSADWGDEEDYGPPADADVLAVISVKHQLHTLISSYSRAPIFPFQLFF